MELLLRGWEARYWGPLGRTRDVSEPGSSVLTCVFLEYSLMYSVDHIDGGKSLEVEGRDQELGWKPGCPVCTKSLTPLPTNALRSV